MQLLNKSTGLVCQDSQMIETPLLLELALLDYRVVCLLYDGINADTPTSLRYGRYMTVMATSTLSHRDRHQWSVLNLSTFKSQHKAYWDNRGRVVKGVGHLDHVWSYGVQKVVSSIPYRGNIVGWVFHPTRWLARFSLIWICISFQILNLFRTLSSWGSGNYWPSAPLLYEVASHVKQLPFGHYYIFIIIRYSVQNSETSKFWPDTFLSYS